MYVNIRKGCLQSTQSTDAEMVEGEFRNHIFLTIAACLVWVGQKVTLVLPGGKKSLVEPSTLAPLDLHTILPGVIAPTGWRPRPWKIWGRSLWAGIRPPAPKRLRRAAQGVPVGATPGFTSIEKGGFEMATGQRWVGPLWPSLWT